MQEDVTFPDEEELATRILAVHTILYENGVLIIKFVVSRSSIFMKTSGIVTMEPKDAGRSLVVPASVLTRCSPARALPSRHMGLVSARGIGPPDSDESEEEEDSDDED